MELDWSTNPAVILDRTTGHLEYLDLCEFCIDSIDGSRWLEEDEIPPTTYAYEVPPIELDDPVYQEEDRALMGSLADRGKSISEIASFYATTEAVVREQLAILWDAGLSLPKGHPFSPVVDGAQAA